MNANIALVTSFSLHADRIEAIGRGQEGFEFFNYAVNALVAEDAIPGHSRLWELFLEKRGRRGDELVQLAKTGDREKFQHAPGIGTPDDFARHLRQLRDAGVDQVILMQQAGKNAHQHIMESLELFAREVMPEFKADAEERQAKKDAALAPYLEAALQRKERMPEIAKAEVPIVPASRKKAETMQDREKAA